MNASDQVIKVLDALCKKFGMAIDFTQKNIVPQIQDFMMRFTKYELYMSIMWLVIGIALLVLGIILLKYILKRTKDSYMDDVELFLGLIVVCLMLGGLATIIYQTSEIIKLITVPEMYFLEYFRTYIK